MVVCMSVMVATERLAREFELGVLLSLEDTSVSFPGAVGHYRWM